MHKSLFQNLKQASVEGGRILDSELLTGMASSLFALGLYSRLFAYAPKKWVHVGVLVQVVHG